MTANWMTKTQFKSRLSFVLVHFLTQAFVMKNWTNINDKLTFTLFVFAHGRHAYFHVPQSSIFLHDRQLYNRRGRCNHLAQFVACTLSNLLSSSLLYKAGLSTGSLHNSLLDQVFLPCYAFHSSLFNFLPKEPRSSWSFTAVSNIRDILVRFIFLANLPTPVRDSCNELRKY